MEEMTALSNTNRRTTNIYKQDHVTKPIIPKHFKTIALRGMYRVMPKRMVVQNLLFQVRFCCLFYCTGYGSRTSSCW